MKILKQAKGKKKSADESLSVTEQSTVLQADRERGNAALP